MGPLMALAAARLGGARQKRRPSECNGERESRTRGDDCHSNRDNRPCGTAVSPKAYGLTAASLYRVASTRERNMRLIKRVCKNGMAGMQTRCAREETAGMKCAAKVQACYNRSKSEWLVGKFHDSMRSSASPMVCTRASISACNRMSARSSRHCSRCPGGR